MEKGLTIALFVAVALTVLSLVAGIISLFAGDRMKQYSQQFMQWRVMAQGLALLIFALLLSMKR